jgi:hypothetical protein
VRTNATMWTTRTRRISPRSHGCARTGLSSGDGRSRRAHQRRRPRRTDPASPGFSQPRRPDVRI